MPGLSPDVAARRVATGWNRRFTNEVFRGMNFLNPIQLSQRIDELIEALNQMTVILEASRPETRQAMADVLRYWIRFFVLNVSDLQQNFLFYRLREIDHPWTVNLIRQTIEEFGNQTDSGDSNDDTSDEGAGALEEEEEEPNTEPDSDYDYD